MVKSDFQQWIDASLANVPSVSPTMYANVHCQPVAEWEAREKVMARLKQTPRSAAPNRVHVGVAGLYNFDIAGQTKPDYMLLLDINRSQEIFWNEIISLLKDAPTPEQFVALLEERTRNPNKPTFMVGEHFNGVDNGNGEELAIRDGRNFGMYFDETCHWLKDADAYAHVRKLAMEGRIATATVDLFNDQARCAALGSALREHGLTSDTCYWSNVGENAAPYRVRWQPTEYGRDYREQYSDTRDTALGTLDKRDRSTESKLRYPTGNFYDSDNLRFTRWDGSNKAFSDLPAYERMLRNAAAIGTDAQSLHVVTNAAGNMPELLLFEGPPSRTPEQWVKREEAKRAHDAATAEGKSIS